MAVVRVLGWLRRAPTAIPAYGLMLLLVNAAAGSPTTGGAAEPVRILALGDSLTAGLGLPAEQAFPARLEAALRGEGHDVRVIDAGVSGDTTAGGLARLDWLLADRPQVAIVALGANDGLRGIDPRETFANLDRIVERLRRDGVRVVLAGMLAPPNLGRGYGEEFAAIYRRLAERHEVLFQPFFLEGVAAIPGLNQADGIHPNSRGVALMVETMLPYLRRALEKVGRG